jgi:hypothetical protein
MVPAMRSLTTLVCLVLASTAAAGCADSGSKAASLSSAPSASATTDTGGIDGMVIDDEQNPVDGANVTLRSLATEFKTSTTSSKDGSFSFSRLEGGAYELLIVAFGYNSRITKVDVVAGEVVKSTSALVRIVVAEALPELLIKKGYINCSVSHASHEGFYSINPCKNQAGEASQIPWAIDPKRNASEAIVEIVWKASGGLGERLQLWLCSDKEDTTNYMNCIQFSGPNPYAVWKDGKSPLVMRQSNLPFKTVTNYEIDLGDGWMETSAPRVPVTFQQSFEAYLTVCFMKKCADDYMGRPPG